jgi:AcrR family transcriptional regulator
VSSLLDAAESVISEHGYEAATMSEIAEKAGASIGSLYQFFPSKQAIVQALRARYRDDFTERWLPIERDFPRLDPEDFASRLMDMVIVFINTHPAFAALLDAPRSTRIPGSMTERVAGFLTTKKPRMPAKSATQIAAVTLHMLKAFNRAWVEAAAPARPALKREFRTALGCYLSARLRQGRVNGR